MIDDYEENRGGDLEDVPVKWRRWFREDKNHSAEWRKEAREDYDFVAGRQWSQDDETRLKNELRPVVTFNRSEIIIDAIAGNEILNRNEVRYIPREQGDALPNELYSEAARWFDDQAEAEDEDSEAFRDSVVCGMGWTETRLDFDDDPEGMPVVDRIDPLEMYWDCGSVKNNLIDARRKWRLKSMTRDEAKEMFPDVSLKDIDAGFWIDAPERYEAHNADPEEYYENEDLGDGKSEKPDKRLRVIHLQYWEWEDYHKVADPFTGQVIEMDDGKFGELQKKVKPFGMQLKAVKQRRKKYKQAFIGRKVLMQEDLPANGFTWNCITAKRDRNKGTWYGVVRAMKDPQRWANKWLSQLLHIINSNSKGGVIIEEGAVVGNIRDFEADWARPDRIKVVADGALTQGKIQPQQPAAFPAGYQMLTEFAVQAIRDVTGVSLEMLGMREAEQSGVLEYQRRQAGMAVLAQMFNALRRYRKRRGALMLHYIQNYLSDGRLVRIIGKDREQYVPLLKQSVAKFDVIVDEAATSPNQKEMVWQSLIQILPGIKDMVPPQVMLSLLEYSPLPASVTQKIKEVVSAPNPEAEQRAQMAMLELQEKQTGIQTNQMAAETDAAKVRLDAEKLEFEQRKFATEAALEDKKIEYSDDAQKSKALVQLVDVLGKLEIAQNRPRKVVRDESGRVAGVE